MNVVAREPDAPNSPAHIAGFVDLNDAAAPIRFEQVSKIFSVAGRPVHALQNVSFQVKAGEIFGIIGRSGAGKSTLIRLINRLERPSSGALLVDGEDVARLDENGLLALRRRTGMIFQHFNLLSAKTVLANVALPLLLAGWKRSQATARAEEMLDLVGLEAKRDVYPNQLSGGQKQRVGIARALVQSPSILLSDEATSALDPETTQSILDLLKRINRTLGLTIVLITHEMAVIRDICERVAVLEKGELVEIGPVWRVFGDPQAQATRALLRTVVHDLPEEISQRLSPNRAGAGYAVLDVRYVGDIRRGPEIGALAGALGRTVHLIHGGIERLAGHPQGRLVLAVPLAGTDDASELAGRLSGLSSHVSILGYAADL